MATPKQFISETPPDLWDGFGFFTDKNDNKVKFYFFDELITKHGSPERDPNVPEDREAFHVILTSVRKGGFTHIEAPFTAHFTDPFTYARHIALSGFTGIMIRKALWSANLLRESLLDIMMYHAKDIGFFYAVEPGGEEIFFKGMKNLPI